MNREPVLQALFALLSSLPGLITKSRRVVLWDQVASENQPALLMGSGTQRPHNDTSGLPTVWTLDVDVHLYVWSSDPTIPPSQVLNGYLDQIEALLKPPAPGAPYPLGFQTLGGLCRHCWIEGDIETSGDLLGDQGVAIIPIQIQVAA